MAMRFHYVSDLHLEAQDFSLPLERGDVLIIAGDLCHSRVFEAAADDGYARQQRERVLRFADKARASHTHIILVPGNHDHYEGVIDDTVAIFRRHLPGFHVLDGENMDLGGVLLFGATLWADFEGRDADAMKRAGKGCGEFFFVKRRVLDDAGAATLARFRPPDALARFDRDVAALRSFCAQAAGKRPIIVTHHAPSRAGLNPFSVGNGLDGAFASNLDELVASSGAAVWIHGHTHIRRKYRIGEVDVLANCRGFAERNPLARAFSAKPYFDLTGSGVSFGARRGDQPKGRSSRTRLSRK
jgi:Icc-related predicted phosphoesterase